MEFIINGKKYITENMEEIAVVRKWYEVNDAITRMLYGNLKVGRVYECTLWRSQKGNWLLTHEQNYTNIGQAIEESEVKELLMRYSPDKYEELFEEIPEA